MKNKSSKEKRVKGWLHNKIEQLNNVPVLPEESYQGESQSHLMQDAAMQDDAQVFSSYEKSDNTCIGSSAIVESGITSEQNIQVDGICKGTVKTDRNVLISGKVEGDVVGQNVFVYGGVVQGNIVAGKKIMLNTKAIILGNLECEDLEADGKIKGNIQAENMVYLKSETIVQGNIRAQAIHTEKGAVINGQVTMISPKNEKEIFALPITPENPAPETEEPTEKADES